MTRRFLAALVCATISFTPLAFAEKENSGGWRAELQLFLTRAAEALNVPGVVAVVVTREEGATVLTHGVRCAGGEAPVTSRTPFGIASLTKAFTATAAASLVGDGVVDWDTRARALIPELELSDPVATERVTLRDLLCHRSGLGDQNLVHLNIDAGPAWLLPRLALLDPVAEYRDRFSYAGLGYALAGEMIGRAADSSWSDVVSERLLEPLGMASTTVGSPAGAEAACGHHFWKGSLMGVEPLELGVGAPGNGLYSTGDDLVRWLELLLGRGEVDGLRIVDAKALQETWTPQVVIRSSGSDLRAYALGWYLSRREGRRHLFHGGGGLGFTSQVSLFPDHGVAIAVLANRAASGLPDTVAERATRLIFGEEVREDLLDMVAGMTARIEALHAASGEALRATADPDAPRSLEPSAYGGCYEHPIYGMLDVHVEDEVATATFHGFGVRLEHLHHDVFMLSSLYIGDLRAAFDVAGGRVSSVSIPLGPRGEEQVFERRAGSCEEAAAPSS